MCLVTVSAQPDRDETASFLTPHEEDAHHENEWFRTVDGCM